MLTDAQLGYIAKVRADSTEVKDKRETREKLEADMEAFLAKGGTVEEVDQGETAYDESSMVRSMKTSRGKGWVRHFPICRNPKLPE